MRKALEGRECRAFVHRTQQWAGRDRYEIHHIVPVSRGGGECNLDNVLVVTPRFDAEVLEGSYHFGGGRR